MNRRRRSAKFASVLGHELNTRVNINSYMSYPTKQGFDNHADRHDVFIVHTEGDKDWTVFPPTMTYPLHKQRNQDPGEPPDAEPYLECRMTPGDVLIYSARALALRAVEDAVHTPDRGARFGERLGVHALVDSRAHGRRRVLLEGLSGYSGWLRELCEGGLMTLGQETPDSS